MTLLFFSPSALITLAQSSFLREKVVELLVNRGADLNVKDGTETTPLHHLVKNKFDVLAMWLVHCGADIHSKDRKMFSPLDYALPSTQHDLRVAAGEISGLHFVFLFLHHHCCTHLCLSVVVTITGAGDGSNQAAPQLYRTPRVATTAPASPSASRSADVRVHLRNGSYKTVRVTSDMNCGTLAKLAAEKFNIDPKYAPFVNLYENKQGTERRVALIENVFNLRQKWPHIISSSGNVTLEQCFFVVCSCFLFFSLLFSSSHCFSTDCVLLRCS